MGEIMSTVKIMLDLRDSGQDDKLQALIALTEARLRLMLGGVTTIPPDLSYIVQEVVIRRFNRLGSEGLTSHTVEGETQTWSDDDFKPYQGDIADWLAKQADPQTGRGRVRFL